MDDRSERLRKRRKQSSETRFTGDGDSAHPSQPDKPSKTADQQSDDDDGDTPIKEKQTGTYMYLPDSQVKELRRQYNILKAEYEFEYDEEFEKNRHFYPLVIECGLTQLQELGVEAIRARLDELYEK
jgi:hypothetical protein